MKLTLEIWYSYSRKIIVGFDYKLVRPISLFILDTFCFLANDSNGLCIIKKEIMLEYQQEFFDRLRRELISNALILIQNPSGNYVLQTAIDVYLQLFNNIELEYNLYRRNNESICWEMFNVINSEI